MALKREIFIMEMQQGVRSLTRSRPRVIINVRAWIFLRNLHGRYPHQGGVRRIERR